MPNRSPARFLAPLALVLALLTVYLVARPELGGSSKAPSSSTPARTTGTGSATGTRTAKAKRTTGTTARSGATAGDAQGGTYTVKAGDVLGSIAGTTGVTVAELLAANPGLDATSLTVGQKLKLAP